MIKLGILFLWFLWGTGQARAQGRALLENFFRKHPPTSLDYDWTTAILLEGALAWEETHPDSKLKHSIDQSFFHLCQSVPEITTPDLAALSLPALRWKEKRTEVAPRDCAGKIIQASWKYLESEPLNGAGALDHVGTRNWLGKLYPSSVWADSMIMYVLNGYRLARDKNSSAREYFFLQQAALLDRLLRDPKTDLYKHAFFVASGTRVPQEHYWARGNMWMSVGLLELWSGLPLGHPARESLKTCWKTHLTAVSKFYVKGKGLRTLLDDPSEASYFESSATALFAFVVNKGMALGALDANFVPIASDLPHTTTSFLRQREDGLSLTQVSGPTTAWKWPWYYTHWVSPERDLSYGVGAYLLMSSLP